MKTRQHLFVNRSHWAVWLMALCMAGSVVSRFLLFSGAHVWLYLILPMLAAVLYTLITTVSGAELLYKTAIPVWIMGLCAVVRFWNMDSRLISWGFVCVCILFFCGVYTAAISGAVSRNCLFPLYIACLVLLWYIVMVFRVRPVALLPELFTVLGMMLLTPAIRIHTDGGYHPTWGDRIDGRRVRTAQVMEQITAYFMPNRNGANNLFSESVEISELERYITRKRREGLQGFGVTHVVLAAYARTVAKYPALNRFIAGQKIYSRGKDVALCMTIKKELTAQAPDSLIKIHLHPGDTAEDVYRKFNAKVAEAKDEMENTTADNTVAAFMMIPGLILKGAIWLLKTMDYFGLIPAFLLEVSPFHGSAYFTAVGSLGIRPVYHHLYDFGTVPVFCAFGRKRKAQEIVNGEVVERKYLDLKFNLDERICDGYYYASVIKYYLRILRHPEVLDTPPERIERDMD